MCSRMKSSPGTKRLIRRCGGTLGQVTVRESSCTTSLESDSHCFAVFSVEPSNHRLRCGIVAIGTVVQPGDELSRCRGRGKGQPDRGASTSGSSRHYQRTCVDVAHRYCP